ncbi:MAG: MFS transporter [Deltaproteobacteria bacterium]|nr:MFS transporter [Deltaproteobacteria bacterium]
MKRFLENDRLFYGWYIVVAAFIILFFNAGARYAFGVMFKPMIEEFGWSRGLVSLVFFVNMVVFALTLIVTGRLYDRYGPKWVIIVSTLFVAAGFALTSTIQSIGQFLLSYGVLAAIGIAGTAVPFIATVTSKWFEKKRGLAISLALSGNSLGHFALVPLFSLFTLSYGWRALYLSSGIIILMVNILIAFFVIRGDPHHLGLKPFGQEGEKIGKTEIKGNPLSSGSDEDFGLKQAMKTRSYWLFVVIMFICGGGDYFATTHLIPLTTDYGVSPQTAGNMLGWYGLMSLAGILVAGPAADRIGNKIPLVLTFALRFFLFLMVLQFKTVPSLYLFALLFGFTHLITAPLAPILIGKLYGVRSIGVLTGFVNTVHFLGGGFWAYIGGVIFDETGSYQLAFLLLAGMAAVAALCGLGILERRHHGCGAGRQ